MVKKYIDTGVAIFRFLKAARNRAKEGMSKEQILDFARREFGEVSKHSCSILNCFNHLLLF